MKNKFRRIFLIFSDPVLNYYHYTLQTVYGDFTFTLPSK
jgi:hypothetical protein